MSKLSNQACLGSLESDEESEVERMPSESPRIQAEDRSCNVRGPFSLGSHDVGGCAFEDLYQRSSTPSKDGVYRDAKPTAFPLLPAKWDDINGLENSDSEDGICEFDPIAKRVQSSSPQLSQPTYDTRKRKAAVLEAEEPFQLEAGDIDAILTPLRDAVCSSFPVASANSGETSKGQDVCSSRVCLPALVATRLLDCDPSSRSEDPSVQAAIRSVMGSSRGRKKARGTDTRNIFAECNDLVPTRSQHLAQAKDPGSVLQYVEAVTKGSNLDGNEQPLTKVPISIAMEDHKHGPLLDKPTQDCAKSTHEKAKEYRAHTDKLGLAKRYNTHTAVNVQAVRGFAVNKDLRITKTGYSGEHLPSGSKGRDKEKVVSLWRNGIIYVFLLFFQRVPFQDPHVPGKQPPTIFRDAEGTAFAVRSNLPRFIAEGLLDELAKVVPELMSRTVVLKSKRMKNNRGMHLFTLYGYDRQNTGWIKAPSFERDGRNGEVFWAYYVPGSVLYRLTGHTNRLLELFFPKIAQRMKDVNYQIKRKYGYISPFGYFWNFCINAPLSSEGIHRVFCQPHIDAENGALLVCAVFVYYYGKVPTKGKEHVWLVLWEAGLIIEVPPGVAILYPSALFLHFNIDIRHLDRIQLGFTTGPGLPTKETLKPLSCENSEEGGRASMVWFTQATILQSADLPDGVHTVGQAKDMEKTAQREAPRAEPYYTATYDVADALARGLFPVKSYTQDIQALSTMEPSIADDLD